jgi:hypothetical protein
VAVLMPLYSAIFTSGQLVFPLYVMVTVFVPAAAATIWVA